jgi:hypothetical protein
MATWKTNARQHPAWKAFFTLPGDVSWNTQSQWELFRRGWSVGIKDSLGSLSGDGEILTTPKKMLVAASRVAEQLRQQKPVDIDKLANKLRLRQRLQRRAV